MHEAAAIESRGPVSWARLARSNYGIVRFCTEPDWPRRQVADLILGPNARILALARPKHCRAYTNVVAPKPGASAEARRISLAMVELQKPECAECYGIRGLGVPWTNGADLTVTKVAFVLRRSRASSGGQPLFVQRGA